MKHRQRNVDTDDAVERPRERERRPPDSAPEIDRKTRCLHRANTFLDVTQDGSYVLFA